MGLHHEHKALHGLHHRHLEKRDEYDNKYRYIHMAGKAEDGQPQGDDNVVTIISQVFVTEPKTFPGPAVYVTKMPVPVTLAPGAVTTGNPYTQTQNSYESAKSVVNQPKTRSHPGQSASASAIVGTPLSQNNGDENHGMSSGGKAGLAIGILAILGLVAGLILFCVRRRKKQIANRGDQLDEKHASKNSFFSGTAAAFGSPAGAKRESVKSFTSTRSASTAPRLSLRPITQFLPSVLEKRRSGNSNNNLSVPPMSEKSRSPSPQNPFADRSASPSGNPFDEPKVDTAAAVPVASAAGAGKATGPNNVHRVQLDFKPSMDDELELKSGQLVRMLHEYDDGWALCIRMDRTQQGVCPRTCLSKLPVKPRPQGAKPSGSSPGARGSPPQGLNKMMPRPLTPTGRERSSTAGDATSPLADAGRRRSQSVSAADGRSVSPIDAGVPARKPLPGQAM